MGAMAGAAGGGFLGHKGGHGIIGKLLLVRRYSMRAHGANSAQAR